MRWRFILFCSGGRFFIGAGLPKIASQRSLATGRGRAAFFGRPSPYGSRATKNVNCKQRVVAEGRVAASLLPSGRLGVNRAGDGRAKTVPRRLSSDRLSVAKSCVPSEHEAKGAMGRVQGWHRFQ